MTYSQLLRYFGTQVRIAEALGIRQSSVARWKSRDRIPWGSQLEAQRVTGGRLKADDDVRVWVRQLAGIVELDERTIAAGRRAR